MKKLAFLILLLAACFAPTAWAQTAPESDTVETTQTDQDEIFVMPVVVDGEELFMLRGSSALPAGERAQLVADRIIALGEDTRSKGLTITFSEGDFGISIFANGQLVTVTTPADADYEQFGLDVLAGLHGKAIEAAIQKYRADRSSSGRIDSAIAALIWTVIFVATAFILARYRHRIPDAIAKRVENRFATVEAATKEMVRGRAIAAAVRFFARLVLLILFFIALYFYLSFVLLAFAETRPFAQLLITYVTDPVFSALKGFVRYLPNLLTLAVIAMLATYGIRGFRLFFENLDAGVFEIRDFDRNWIWPSYNIARAVLILVAIVLAFPYIPGSGSAAFKGVSILVGIMVSLGSNSVVGNLLAGLFVIYRRSTSIGDRIKIGEHIGDVVQIKLMETHIKSIKNELISIPNSQLLNSEVVNYSSMVDGRGLMLHTTVGIGYEEPHAKIEAMLAQAAARTDGIKKSPAPFVLITGLADFAINYQINGFSTRGSSIPKIQSDLHRNIIDVFNENSVQIMTPSYMSDPTLPKLAEHVWDGVLAKT